MNIPTDVSYMRYTRGSPSAQRERVKGSVREFFNVKHLHPNSELMRWLLQSRPVIVMAAAPAAAAIKATNNPNVSIATYMYLGPS